MQNDGPMPPVMTHGVKIDLSLLLWQMITAIATPYYRALQSKTNTVPSGFSDTMPSLWTACSCQVDRLDRRQMPSTWICM